MVDVFLTTRRSAAHGSARVRDFSMTDAFEAQRDFAPAQSDAFAVSGESASTSAASEFDALDAPPADEPKEPNGFVKLGLAPELIAAVEDLGFTQPTAVQEQAIP